MKVGTKHDSLANVKLTAKKFVYYVGITNRERLFSSHRRIQVERV